MGRYAWFSTGMEYKFWFATQSSADILMFRGSRLYCAQDDCLLHMWRSSEQDDVWACILRCGMSRDDIVNWVSKYEPTLKGTEALHHDFDNWERPHMTPEMHARLNLGLVIWHQLRYTQTLYAEFEE